jgi:hypothetical protein
MERDILSSSSLFSDRTDREPFPRPEEAGRM